MLKTAVIRPRPFVSALPQRIDLLPSEEEALRFLLPISGDYPGIGDWFSRKVLPGIRQDTRRIIKIERSGSIAALGIAKKEGGEYKICTVRVAERFVGMGMGLRIFDELLKWLEVDQPHLTVSEQKLPAFKRIFEYYGFRLTSTEQGRYLPGCVEFSYNEMAILNIVAQTGDFNSFGTKRSSAPSNSVLPISKGNESSSA